MTKSYVGGFHHNEKSPVFMEGSLETAFQETDLILVSSKVREQLAELSDQKGVSFSSIIEMLIEKYRRSYYSSLKEESGERK